jgi:hypothetical protein
VLTALPAWFRAKIRNHDDRSQHHMLSPAVPQSCTRWPTSPATPPATSPARSRPSAQETPSAPSAPLAPATNAWPAMASLNPFRCTCLLSGRFAPGTASGSATAASHTLTSPAAQRSSPLSTEPAGSSGISPPSS